MSPVTTKCATAASIFALLSLPSDRQIADQPLSHADFPVATGYVRRTINDTPVHAVDWDGKPGVETVLRENGRRSKGFWRDVREWRAEHPGYGLEAYGTRVCELLQRHFGPYDKATAEVLGQRRELEGRKAQVTKALEHASSASLRFAAREYLGLTAAPSIALPLPVSVLMGGVHTQPTEINGSTFQLSVDLSTPEPTLATSEALLLREYLTLRVGSDLPTPKSLSTLAKEILEKARPLESTLDEIDQALWGVRLPPIPCEGAPADPDIIPYGRLICRHRAVIAALPLAEAGFDIELVNGARDSKGVSFAHLFVYSKEMGVLEASAEGPEFWMKVKGTSGDPELPVLEMEDGSRYRFYHRTKVVAR